MSEFKGVRAFLMIPPSISLDKELLKKPKSIILMGEIISMLNVTGEFFMSNKKIAQRLDCSKSTVNDYLSLLEDKKLIKRIIIKDKSNGSIIGRKIQAGDDLYRLIRIGWTDISDEGIPVGKNTLVRPTLHKYNNLKDQHNRSVNKSSSKSSSKDEKDNIKNQNTEEDPKREKIYKSLFQIARMNDQWKGTRTVPTPDQIRQLRMLLYQCDYISLDAILQVFTEKMKSDQLFEPWKYVLKLMRDKVATQNNFESWGS
ncbi:helix-turn-helix domain-containing protein [Lactobacillus crispatus]|uniref:helix-turn-helix domain-containing protein n=1 Tax=Lactobacillus crispatus TaxID=47770 RepID=UPI0011D29A73|nr:helix-turn-helix domain-containing protein [Lactobacillus crispatus]